MNICLKATVFFLLFFACCFLNSCTDYNESTPKPRGFPKVVYPEKNYQAFAAPYCPFNFEKPAYAKIVQDTSFFGERPNHDCWFDLYIPAFDSRVHFTYYPIDAINTFDKLRSDEFRMANKHNIKATAIIENPIRKPNGVSGMAFDIQGAVASPFQLYLTDEKEHFLRGSLYFNTQAKPDSLAPVYDFVKRDIMHMVNTFEWN